MQYIKPKVLLDDVMLSLTDRSAGRRRQLLSWMNAVMQGILNEPRDWNFLHKSATLTITSNSASLPTDFADLELVFVDDVFCFNSDNELTAKEAFAFNTISCNKPVGYTKDIVANTITFVPGTDEATCTLYYQAGWPSADYHDTTTDTIIPVAFTNLVQRAILSNVYEFDREEFTPLSVQLDAEEMKKMKAWDNRLTPLPKTTPNGYLRERV